MSKDGKSKRSVLKKAAEKREVKTLKQEPILYGDLVDIWNMFFEISTGRQTGFGVCALSWVDIITYLQSCGMAQWKIQEAKRLIKAMDMKFLAHYNKDKNGNTTSDS